jgi:phosphoribosylformylglycinamidine synthase
MYKANITVTLRSSILDPQGKASEHALSQLGFDSISQVRIGKYVEMDIVAESLGDAREIAESACAKLLANSVMEDYHITLNEVVAA